MGKTYTFDDSVVFDAIDDVIKDLEVPFQEEDKEKKKDTNDIVDNQYEPYNFEEEELEEDDYHYDDLD